MIRLYITLILTFLFADLVAGQSTRKIVFITSNQHTYGNTKINAANHFGELVFAYDVFMANGFEVDIVSPNGGAIPIGYIKTSDPIHKKYIYDAHFMHKLKNTKTPESIDPSEYQAIYYCGGGSAMFGVADNTAICQIAQKIYRQNGIISTVCHGTAGIVYLKDDQGNALYLKRKINGYPDLFENQTATYFLTFPFSIENTINAEGGAFVYAEKRNSGFFVQDGRFITGQDPSSAAKVAQKVIEAILAKE